MATSWRAYQENLSPSIVHGIPDISINSAVEIGHVVLSYCPSWALPWPYRRQNLLREIVGYGADIVHLQEVQSDHFEEFFAPELDKYGYQSLFKRKTAEVV